MKLSNDSRARRRLMLFSGLLLTLWATWQIGKEAPAPKIVSERAVRRLPAKPPTPMPALALEWSIRQNSLLPIADVFGLPPQPVAGKTAPLLPSVPVPVFNLKYLGHLLNGNSIFVFLTDIQNQVITVRSGEPVDNEWNLIDISTSELVFRHNATGIEHTMQIGTRQ